MECICKQNNKVCKLQISHIKDNYNDFMSDIVVGLDIGTNIGNNWINLSDIQNETLVLDFTEMANNLKDGYTMITKGAVDVVIPRTKYIQIDGEVRTAIKLIVEAK